MKTGKKIFWIGLICFPVFIYGQKNKIIEGTISYKSNKNIYVKFVSTDGISVGDTLMINDGIQWVKSLIVKQKSSTSCVTENFTSTPVSTGQQIVFTQKETDKIEELKIENLEIISKEIIPPVTPDSILSVVIPDPEKKKQITTGRLTFSTNASINPDDKNNFQRIRAAATFNFQNINQSAFSFQTYLTYRHRYGVDQTNYDFYDDFKVFSLALQYAPSKNYSVWFGRRLNNNIANMGAIDGLQGEYNFGSYIVGLFAGTRPDFTNFTFNAKLPQYGAYIVRNDQTKSGIAQTSIAIAEQQNDFKTDRRFLYFQHNNSLVKNLNLFFSSEIDLFENIRGETFSKPKLTSIYASLRYRLRKNLSFSGSYDNRRNIIYYESYQTIIEQLLAQETRHGFRIQANYAPFKRMNINVSSFFRYQGNNTKPTSNYVINAGFNNLVRKSTSAAFNVNLLESYYFKGTIIGGRISDVFLKGKINAEVNYRNINYTFFNTQSSLRQNIGGFNISFSVLKKTTLMASYEGTFEPSRAWHRYFITITQRIKN